MTYLTVGELMERLMEYDEECPVYLRLELGEDEYKMLLARDITEEETTIIGQRPNVIVDAWQ